MSLAGEVGGAVLRRLFVLLLRVVTTLPLGAGGGLRSLTTVPVGAGGGLRSLNVTLPGDRFIVFFLCVSLVSHFALGSESCGFVMLSLVL